MLHSFCRSEALRVSLLASWQFRARRVRVPLQLDYSGVWWPPAGRAAAAGDESDGGVGRGRRSCEALCVGWFLAIIVSRSDREAIESWLASYSSIGAFKHHSDSEWLLKNQRQDRTQGANWPIWLVLEGSLLPPNVPHTEQ